MDRNYPLTTVVDGCLISRRAEMTVGWELFMPTAFSLELRDYDEMFAALASAVRRLDPWCIVHKQDIYMTRHYKARREERFLADAYERHFDGRPYLEHRCFIFVTKSTKAACEAQVRDNGLLAFSRKQCPFTHDDIRNFILQSGEFITTFCGTHIRYRELTTMDFLGTGDDFGLLDQQRMLYRESRVFHHNRLFEDRVEIGDDTLQSFLLNESTLLPGVFDNVTGASGMSTETTAVYNSYGSRVGISLGFDHVTNLYLMTLPQEGVKAEFGLRLRRMRAASGDASNDVSHEEMTKFLRYMESEGEVVVKAHFNVLVWGPKEQTEYRRSQVTQALSDLNTTAVANDYDTPVIWYSSIPGCGSELGEQNWMKMSLSSAVSLCSFETFDKGMGEGTLSLCDRITHVPIRLDFRYEAMRRKLITNYNKFLVGPSGAGKSFWTNHFLLSCYEAGEHVFIIDVGGSYQGLTRIIREESGGMDGVYMEWDNRNPISFAPFVGVENWLSPDGALNEDENGLICLLAFLRAVWTPDKRGWDAERTNILKAVVRSFLLSRVGNPPVILEDLLEYMRIVVQPSIMAVPQEMDRDGETVKVYIYEGRQVEPLTVNQQVVDSAMFDMKNFLIALDDYSKAGGHGHLLNNPEPKDLMESRWTVFDVDRLAQAAKPVDEGSRPDPFYGIVIMFLMNAIDDKMRHIDGPKQVSIDEAWQALSNPALAGFLRGFYKTGRKYQCGFMVITQQLSDLRSSKIVADAILRNSDVTVLLDQSGNRNDFNDNVSLLGLSKRDVNLVMSIGGMVDPRYNYRECFIKWMSKQSGVYALEESREARLAFESEFGKKGPLMELADKIGMRRAITESLAQLDAESKLRR